MIKISHENFKTLFSDLDKENKQETIEQIILTLKEKELYNMAPESMKCEKLMKKALEAKVINIMDLEEEEKNKISKEYYLKLIKINKNNSLVEEMWKDKETVIEAIKSNGAVLEIAIQQQKINIEEDINKIMEIFDEADPINTKLLCKNIDKSYIKEIEKRDSNLIMKILKCESQVYNLLNDEKKKDIKYVNLMLSKEVFNGYFIVKDTLSKIKDKEITIKALEQTSDAKRYIYPPYIKILKDNNVKSNYGNFLKIYWLYEELQEEEKINNPIIKKNKI